MTRDLGLSCYPSISKISTTTTGTRAYTVEASAPLPVRSFTIGDVPPGFNVIEDSLGRLQDDDLVAVGASVGRTVAGLRRWQS